VIRYIKCFLQIQKIAHVYTFSSLFEVIVSFRDIIAQTVEKPFLKLNWFWHKMLFLSRIDCKSFNKIFTKFFD